MEKIKQRINHPVFATIISLCIMFCCWILVLIVNHRTIKLDPIIRDVITPFFIFIIISNLLLSYFFYYLNKKLRLGLYFLIFFFFVWAILFFMSNYSSHKSQNKIIDNMEGVSDAITSIIIFFIIINLFSNFSVLLIYYLKEKYFQAKCNL